MLFPQQVADQIFADLNLGFDHARSQYLRHTEPTPCLWEIPLLGWIGHVLEIPAGLSLGWTLEST